MWTLALALVLDAAFGDPAPFYRRLPHPIVLIGRAITALERRLLDPEADAGAQRRAGIGLLAIVVTGALLIGHLVGLAAGTMPGGWLVETAAMSTLIAQRGLVDHVEAVARGLRADLAAGRAAVAHIVGRDPERLDAHGVTRAAIESLAENLSDGVVAPAFWGLVLGLPGMLAYKAINTADSMVGHLDPRHRHFGWASARLDDLVNLVPARLTAGLLVIAAGRSARAAWHAVRRDAPHHRSPNAGWPEAAMAGALGVRLAGPRTYGGRTIEDAWMGDGSAAATPDDIDRAVALAWRAWAMLLVALGMAGLVTQVIWR